jgi:protein-disulfide isomerase
MNNQPSSTTRVFTWIGFVIVIGLIIWGLVVANKKAATGGTSGAQSPTLTLLTPVSAADWMTGSTTAALKLVEYSDLQCPACQAYHEQVLKQLLAEEGSKFTLVYRHFPLTQHLNADPAAIAAEAAGRQGKFWEMHDMLFDTQTDWEDSKDPSPIFLGYAKTLGLDLTKFNADVSDGALRKKIEDSEAEGNKVGIYQTPTFFINGKSIDNPTSYADFKALIEKNAQ